MKCPGQDTRYWKGDAIFEVPCPNCGHMVEFFKDESTHKCKNCGAKVINPKMDFGCAAHCKFAAQCLGELPPELLAMREDLFKDRVAIEVKLTLKKDFKRVGHATRSARYAEKIVKKEGGDLAVVLSAAYLQDVVVRTSGEYRAEKGPGEKVAAARAILEKLGAREDLLNEVCEIIDAIHTGKTIDSINFGAVKDAIWIATMQERLKNAPEMAEDMKSRVDAELLTEAGKELARQVLKEILKDFKESIEKPSQVKV